MENTKNITLPAPAKINVCLGVTRKRGDGYHDIDSVMQTVALCDSVSVSLAENARGAEITVLCPGHESLEGEKNIAFRAAKSYFDYTKTENYSVSIVIEKVIPMEAGLGGGSSDAAAVLLALNALAPVPLEESELISIGARVGADVPFLLRRGTALVGGIGEKLSPCRPLPETSVLIAYPKHEKVATGKAYAAIDARGEFSSPSDFEKMKLALESGNISEVAGASYNIFESVLPGGSAVFGLKKEMLAHGALMSLMSGSGSAVFGFFPSDECARTAAEALALAADTFVTELFRAD